MHGIPKAIEACNCKVEIAAAKTLRWWQLKRFSGLPTAGLAVALGEKAALIEQPAATPWSEAYRKIETLRGPVNLVAK